MVTKRAIRLRKAERRLFLYFLIIETKKNGKSKLLHDLVPFLIVVCNTLRTGLKVMCDY